MDLKGTDRLTATQIGPNYQVVEELLATTLKHLELLYILRTCIRCL